MEIFNRVDVSLSNVNKTKKKQDSQQVSFSAKETVSSATAMESIAKAKISLDSTYTKPISLDKKIGILQDRKIPEEGFALFLSQNDDEFAKMLEYVDSGLTVEDIKLVYGDSWNSETLKKAAELAKYKIPFGLAKDVYTSYYKIPEERIELLKQADFDFSREKTNFNLDSYKVRRILQDDEQFAKFNAIYQKGVEPNIAVVAANLQEAEYQQLSTKIGESKVLSPSATAAYFLSRFKDEDVTELVKLSKTYKLDFNDYDFWINSYRKHDFSKIGELVSLGVPFASIQKGVFLDEVQIKDALSIATEYEILPEHSIEIYEYSRDDEARRKKSCELLRDNKLELYTAYHLAQYDKKVADTVIGYLERGLDYNAALGVALLDNDEAYKERVISLLGTFKYAGDAKQFLDKNLSEEDSAKVLDLVNRGANLYFALYCLEKPEILAKVNALCESKKEVSLEGLYGGWDEEVLEHLDYVAIGVPGESVSHFSYNATQDEVDLLKSGVRYDALKPLKKYEETGADSSAIREFLKKGISFNFASKLYDRVKSSDIPIELVAENIYPNLEEYKVVVLANLQKDRGNDWLDDKDKETVVQFVGLLKNLENLGKFVDNGFLNKKAMENYNEFIKRGISSKHSNYALLLSQIEFKNSDELDRVVELLKREVPFHQILFSFSDDKSFMNAIIGPKDSHSYSDRTSLNSYLVKFYKEGFKKEDIAKISQQCNYASDDTLAALSKYLEKGHCLDDAIKISEHFAYSPGSIEEDPEKTMKIRELFSDMILQGCHFEILRGIYYDERKIEKLTCFLDQGIEPRLAEKLALCNISPEETEKVAKVKEIDSSTINEDLKKASGNPMLYSFIDELYNFDNYNEFQLAKLINSKVTLQDVALTAKTFIKSPLKQAMKRPNLYLSGIPQEDTEKVNGQYPTLSPAKMAVYQEKMLNFFKGNMVEITRALKYLDADTFNQMMDKRTHLFSQQLEMLNKMDDKHYELVSKITKCRKNDGKLLSSKEKIDLAKIVLYHQLGYIDTSYLEEIVESGTVDVVNLNKKIFDKLIDTIGLTHEEAQQHSDKLNFDEEYMYLLLRTQKSADFMWVKDLLDDRARLNSAIDIFNELLSSPEGLAHNGLTEESARALLDLLKRVDTMEEKEVYRQYNEISPFASVDITAQDVARIAILENFTNYVQDETNDIGKVNAKTRKEFENIGIDYNKWINYQEKDSVSFDGHNFDIKMWDRNPQKDLFMGNRTSCCTAIIDGANGKATPIYLSNTAFNVVQMTDENGNIVAMSRIFVGRVDDKPSIIIENIEINNSFLKNKTPDELTILRDKMFAYVKNLSEDVSEEKEMNVYFSKNYTHVPLQEFTEVEKKVSFVGNISSDTVYLNCKPGWTSLQDLTKEPCKLFQIS